MNPTVNANGYVEQVQKGSARYLYLPAMVAAIGGLLFGFDTAVINGAIVFIKRQFLLSDSQTEIAASSLLLGCVVGASLAAFTSDRFGRKKVLLGAAALFTISSIGTALPRNLIEFVIARFAGGVAIGMASTLSPLYIAEISPARSRGLLVSLNQLAIVTGILLFPRYVSFSRYCSFLKVLAGWCRRDGSPRRNIFCHAWWVRRPPPEKFRQSGPPFRKRTEICWIPRSGDR